MRHIPHPAAAVAGITAAAALPLAAATALALAATPAAAQNHFSLDGSEADNGLGTSSANIGDINQDGYADAVLGEPGSANNGIDSGRVRVISGKNGALIRTHDGPGPGRRMGKVVSAAGDQNGDGVPDYAIGSTFGNEFMYPSGEIELRSGADGSLIRTYSSSSNWDHFGASLAAVGDIDGDGLDDLAIGAYDDDWSGLGSGAVFIYSGADGHAIHTLRGAHPWDRFGFSLIGCGDMDFDGVPDFGVGAPNQKAGAKSAGKVTFHSGATGAQLSSARGRDRNAFFGTGMVSLGDINGDMVPDAAVSGIDDSTNIKGLDAHVQIISGADGSVIQTLEQEADGERFGFALAAVDVNGDGLKDLIAGTPMAGQIGGTGLASGRIEAFSGPSGRLLFRQDGDTTRARFGGAICSVDDLDGNGLPELLVSSPGDGAGSQGGGFVETFAPPEVARLVQPTLASGSNANIQLLDGTWYSTFWVYASLSGIGSGSPDGNELIDLAGPLIYVGKIDTDANGNGSMNAFVPNGMTGTQVWLQGWRPIGEGGISTLTTAVIQ
jgi:hypothetical protein